MDVVVLGDGYTAAEEQKFLDDADTVVQDMLSITPYFEYSNYLRIHEVFVASPQSGADHPPYSSSCQLGDPSCRTDQAAQQDPLSGQFRDTAFDSTFCFNGVWRLLVPDTDAVQQAADSAVPQRDQIILIVNDPEYGGSGGPVATVSVNEFAIEILRHEYGHSFTRLADEYDDPNPGFGPCSDLGLAPPCEANVTDETDEVFIKWKPWITADTIPTPEGQPQYQDDVGLFEGARYLTTGMYRPKDVNCLMHFLEEPFDPVCTQAYVLRLYAGGWGTPSLGISTIEPGLESPGLSSFRKCSGDVEISVQTLGPQSGPPPTIEWRIDHQAVSGATSSSFTYSSTATGTELVTVSVLDPAPLVHPDMNNGTTVNERDWTIETVSLPASLTLEGQQLSTERTEEACDTITVGPAFEVTGSGSLILRAGNRVVLRDGFSVESGGQLTVETGPVFP